MLRNTLALTLLVLVSAPVEAGPLQPDPVPKQPGAVKGVSFPYPSRAPIVVSLNGYDKPRERLSKLVAAAAPDDADRITKLVDSELNELFEGRKLDSLRRDARIFLVLNDLAALFDDQIPPVAIILPVTSYKDFRESFLTRDELKTLDHGQDGVDAIKTKAFGEEMPAYLVDLKDYVALSINKATADGYAAKYTPGTLEPFGPDLSESFLKADLAVYINMVAVNEQYGEQIRAFKGLIDFGLQQALQQGNVPWLSVKQLDAMKVVLKGAFQAAEDCQAVVLSLEIKKEGLLVRAQARFGELTASTKLLSLQSPEQHAELGKLPAGLGVYTAMKLDSSIATPLRLIQQEFTTTEDDIRGIKLIEQHLKDLDASGYQGEYSATTAPGLSLTVAEYDKPEKAVRALAKTYKAIAPGGRVNSMVLKAAPRVTDEAEQHREYQFTEVRLNFDFEATVAGIPEQSREGALQSLKNSQPERTIMWIGTNGKNVVKLTAENWTAAQAVLDRFLDGKPAVGTHASYRATRAQLPRDVNFLLMAETSSAISTILDSLRSAGEAVPGIPKLPVLKPHKGEPAFVGLSVTFAGDTATVTGFVPVGAISVARKLLKPLLKKID